ncbi:Receptor-like serine/threonine-protein kinase [Heracleum sosnowskyi]|uniref:Receptor-like serine/threonine-protein kinase n=1 Tax=Heracleum sosnowskyi TaxID=360622 RepID=A0AAD8N4K2_9APIA|nr:Receptor-like serine/threonine-protein kinase [Heracleum sosnowskyi]
METWAFLNCIGICLFILLQPQSCMASIQKKGSLPLGFRGDQMLYIDNNGVILLSNNSDFGFGFFTTDDVTLFLLAIVHLSSSTTIWSANRDNPVRNNDYFVFNESGNAYLESGDSRIWSTNTAEGGSVMELQNSGNLVLLADDGSVIWQSFNHPADTLLSNQEFSEGMKLVSNRRQNKLSYFLEMKSGDLLLYANYENPQPYWSMGQDNRKIINKNGAGVILASLDTNSWRFYDKNKVLLWQFIFSNSDKNTTWAATLGDDGFVTFYTLESGSSKTDALVKIPADYCSRPQSCDPYQICGTSNNCQCPNALASQRNCRPDVASSCEELKGPMELVDAGDGLGYFALGFVPPSSKTDLNGCKTSCSNNCSCLLMFFENKSGNCFHFDHVGSFRSSKEKGFASYIKISTTDANGGDSSNDGSSKKHAVIVVIIVTLTTFVVLVLLFVGVRYFRKSKDMPESPRENSEEDIFLESISGMPVRFSYKDLQVATKDFSAILGRGGFGSVYEGILPDGTRLAVKQLEGIGQGRKNYDASETSGKSHFPTYAFKMMEEGKLTEIVDANLQLAKTDPRVMVAIKVALWCIQDDMYHRPSMTKVVQMLEGLLPVPPPPMSLQMNSRLYSNFYKSISEEGTSSGPSDCNSDAYLSAVRLSGPR